MVTDVVDRIGHWSELQITLCVTWLHVYYIVFTSPSYSSVVISSEDIHILIFVVYMML